MKTIELPVEIGQTVYWIERGNEIKTGTVDIIVLYEGVNAFRVNQDQPFNSKEYTFFDIGKTVFTSLEDVLSQTIINKKHNYHH